MDFLGIGVPELIVILILMVIFVGPRDLPRMAGKFAKFLRDLRAMTEGLTSEWQKETDIMADLDVGSLKELRDEIDATKKTIQNAGTNLINLDELTRPTPKKTVAKDSVPAPKPKLKPETPKSSEENISGGITKTE